MRALLLMAAALTWSGCSDETSTPADMTVFQSSCGKPGDVGNSVGVGKFCTAGEFVAQCGMNRVATVCANLGDEHEFFCTAPCDATDAGAPDQCGENAICACDSMGRGCGCFPLSCK
jgi:hypothetical protein